MTATAPWRRASAKHARPAARHPTPAHTPVPAPDHDESNTSPSERPQHLADGPGTLTIHDDTKPSDTSRPSRLNERTNLPSTLHLGGNVRWVKEWSTLKNRVNSISAARAAHFADALRRVGEAIHRARRPPTNGIRKAGKDAPTDRDSQSRAWRLRL